LSSLGKPKLSTSLKTSWRLSVVTYRMKAAWIHLQESDVVIFVNIIIGEITPTDAQYETANVNGDEYINVQDLVSLINIILYN